MADADAVTITESNFEEVVLKAKCPVLVDFWAEWCAPCKALTPAIKELAAEYAGKAVVGKLNIDENPAVSSQFSGSAIPTLLIFRDGEVSERIVGLRAKKDLADLLDRVLA